MTTNTTNNQEAQVNTLVNTQENHKVNRIDALARLVRDRWSKSDANDEAALKEELRKFAKTQPDHHLSGDDEPGMPELLRVPDDFKRAAFSVLCVAVDANWIDRYQGFDGVSSGILEMLFKKIYKPHS